MVFSQSKGYLLLLSQYVNGKKNPSKKQVNRIVDGLHEIGKELLELTLV